MMKEMDKRFKSDPYVLQIFRDAETTPSDMFYMLRDLDKSVSSMTEQEKKIRETGLRKVLKVLVDPRYPSIVATVQGFNTPKDIVPNYLLEKFFVANSESAKNLLIRTINFYLEELNPKVCPIQTPCPIPTCPILSKSNILNDKAILGISFVMFIVIILVVYFLLKK